MFAKLQAMRDNREQGFTLIELLVVILIIGILAAVAIPMFMNQRKGAVDATVKSDVKNAALQVETWVARQGATVDSLPVGPAAPGAATLGTAHGALNDIKVSDGTILRVSGTSMAFCIVGTNSGGDLAATSASNLLGIVYISDTGGLQQGEGSCNTTTYPGGFKYVGGSATPFVVNNAIAATG